MKQYTELTTIEKAKLLHEWFPNEINRFLSFAGGYAKLILRNANELPQDYNKRKIEPEKWIEEAKILKQKIETHHEQLAKDSDFFSVTLFKGYLDFFPAHCLLEYTLVCANGKFSKAVEFLFDT